MLPAQIWALGAHESMLHGAPALLTTAAHCPRQTRVVMPGHVAGSPGRGIGQLAIAIRHNAAQTATVP